MSAERRDLDDFFTKTWEEGEALGPGMGDVLVRAVAKQFLEESAEAVGKTPDEIRAIAERRLNGWTDGPA
jgi:hypothetical protein